MLSTMGIVGADAGSLVVVSAEKVTAYVPAGTGPVKSMQNTVAVCPLARVTLPIRTLVLVPDFRVTKIFSDRVEPQQFVNGTNTP